MTVSVRFRHFWLGVRPEIFWIPLIQSAGYEVRIVGSRETSPDLDIVSVYPPGSIGWKVRRRMRLLLSGEDRLTIEPDPKAAASIWYTAENLRPPLGNWDQYWSFDPTSVAGRNSYFPIWWRLFPELLAPVRVDTSEEDRVGRTLTLDEFTSPRLTPLRRRPRFACLFTSHPEPTRMSIVRALESIGQVDIYGPWNGRPVASKAEIASEYRYVICPENDVYPGYVTEKVFDAWACGAVPIWSGIDREGYVNPSAVVNLQSLPSLDALIERVAHLERDHSAYHGLWRRPLLVKRPSLAPARNDLRRLLGN